MSQDVNKILKALSDENRLRIFHLINHKNLCVCEIEQILNITQSNASRHLSKLKEADLIDFKKEGLYIRYFIHAESINNYPFIQSLLDQTKNLEPFKNDSLKISKICGCVIK